EAEGEGGAVAERSAEAREDAGLGPEAEIGAEVDGEREVERLRRAVLAEAGLEDGARAGVGVEPDAAGAEPPAGDDAGGHGDVAVVALAGAGAGGPREVDGEPGARLHERRGEVDAAAEVVLAVVGAARDARADAGAARARAPGRQQARPAERVLLPRVRDELDPKSGRPASGR